MVEAPRRADYLDAARRAAPRDRSGVLRDPRPQMTSHDLAAAMEPNSVAAALVFENRWAAVSPGRPPHGGQLIASEGRIPIQAIIASLEADESPHAPIEPTMPLRPLAGDAGRRRPARWYCPHVRWARPRSSPTASTGADRREDRRTPVTTTATAAPSPSPAAPSTRSSSTSPATSTPTTKHKYAPGSDGLTTNRRRPR